MNLDAAADQLLRDVVDAWMAEGPLEAIVRLSGQVWRTNLDRHEDRLGDDPQVLGIQCSRNLCNLAIRQLQGHPGLEARDRNTLEVRFQGRTLHVSKAPPGKFNVMAIDWATSEVRDEAARRNSEAYQPNEATLFEALPALEGQHLDAAALSQLHYVWRGFPDGGVESWIGFPRLDMISWFALLTIEHGDGDRGGRTGEGDRPSDSGPKPTFDSLTEPQVPLIRRPTTVRPPAQSAGGDTEERRQA